MKDTKVHCLDTYKKTQESIQRDGRYTYNLYAWDADDTHKKVLEYNLLRKHLLHFLDTYKENVKRKDEYTKIGFGEVRPDTTESTSDTTVSETDIKGHE